LREDLLEEIEKRVGGLRELEEAGIKWRAPMHGLVNTYSITLLAFAFHPWSLGAKPELFDVTTDYA
jgi:flavorubredoxin